MDESELDPWKLFLNAMRAPMTRDRYQTRVAKFFDFIGIRGKTLEQKARTFSKKAKNDTNWALSSILKFVYYQRERVDKKEISGATVRNYTKSIRLWYEVQLSSCQILTILHKVVSVKDTSYPHLPKISTL